MSRVIHPGSIVILDFGGQYAHLIARRVRECGAFSEIFPPETPAADLRNASGIILSGGPQSVYEEGSPQADLGIFDLGIPILGLCYGHHWIGHMLGGKVQPALVKEYGATQIRVVQPEGSLFEGVPSPINVWMSHGDEVTVLPAGFVTVASSEDCVNAAMMDAQRKIFGIQFHLEVAHTQHGMAVLRRFVDLCDHAPWSVERYAQRIGEEILKQVGDRRVFMLVSGGVDSTVAFTVLNEVLGPARVQGLLIDTGLMRKGEVLQIIDAFDILGIDNLEVVDASTEFFANLSGVAEPERKRAIIGNTFLAVQKRISEKMGLRIEEGWMLGQGTIYPDTIETGSTRHADTIKTHHNRVDAVQRMIEAGLVIEPLKELYKDEVRLLGGEFRLPHELVWRHPFPGPGLGVRILCALQPEHSPLTDTDPLTAPYRSLVLPVKSVGVQGDGRTYRHALALFSDDPLTITERMIALATSIPNAQRELNRVLLCTSHAVPPPLSFAPGYITKERADLLREADGIVDEEMRAAKLYESIWQFPVVLLPFGAQSGQQSIVLRPIDSTEAMTAVAVPLPPDVVERITRRILALKGIDMVFLDLTNKPPATIEWE